MLGEVVAFHIDDALIRDGRFDTAAAQPLARCGYQDYAVVESLIALARPPGGEGRNAGLSAPAFGRLLAFAQVDVDEAEESRRRGRKALR